MDSKMFQLEEEELSLSQEMELGRAKELLSAKE